MADSSKRECLVFRRKFFSLLGVKACRGDYRWGDKICTLSWLTGFAKSSCRNEFNLKDFLSSVEQCYCLQTLFRTVTRLVPYQPVSKVYLCQLVRSLLMLIALLLGLLLESRCTQINFKTKILFSWKSFQILSDRIWALCW